MNKRTKLVLMAGIAASSLAIGSASPSPAAEIKKFEGTIAAPLPVVSAELASDYATGEALRMTCPEAGDGDGIFYKFFDLKAEYKFFFVSGGEPVISEPDPSGVLGGSIQDYDLDLHLFDAKCNIIEVDGDIITGSGHAPGIGFKPARYAAISYFSGPYPDIAVTLEASTEKIIKK